MAALPELPHLAPSVYEPSDDSYLLLDVLDVESAHIMSFFSNCAIVSMEVGGGSGVLSAGFTTRMRSHGAGIFHFVLDINPEACAACSKTMHLNGLSFASQVIQTDLTSSSSVGT